MNATMSSRLRDYRILWRAAAAHANPRLSAITRWGSSTLALIACAAVAYAFGPRDQLVRVVPGGKKQCHLGRGRAPDQPGQQRRVVPVPHEVSVKPVRTEHPEIVAAFVIERPAPIQCASGLDREAARRLGQVGPIIDVEHRSLRAVRREAKRDRAIGDRLADGQRIR